CALDGTTAARLCFPARQTAWPRRMRRGHVECNRNSESIMRTIALAVALLVGLIAPAVAQKAEIEAANAKWMELFNKGDFDGVAALYTEDATAFPPGSALVKG